jgi:UDP:flavonoid glycosyltransferase YjiC (YdhE family)
MHSEETERLLDIVLKSSADLNIRALVPQEWVQSTGWRMPENTFAVGQEAFRHLFPRLAAVVHHGGAGTTTTAALAGVPQVVIPHVMDQFYWGHRVHSLGIGSEPLNRKQFSQRLLSIKLSEVLCSSSMSERAHSLAVELSGRNGALELANILLDEKRKNIDKVMPLTCKTESNDERKT